MSMNLPKGANLNWKWMPDPFVSASLYEHESSKGRQLELKVNAWPVCKCEPIWAWIFQRAPTWIESECLTLLKVRVYMSMNLPKGANLNWKWNLVLFFFFLFVIFTLFTFRICVLFSFFCVFFAHLVRARMVQICVSAIYIWKKFEVWPTLYKKTLRPLNFFLRKFLKNLSNQKCSKVVGEHVWKNLSDLLKY